MKHKSQNMRDAIDDVVTPALVDLGFTIRTVSPNGVSNGAARRFRDYHRLRGETLDIFDVFFWDYGWTFKLETFGGAIDIRCAKTQIPRHNAGYDLIMGRDVTETPAIEEIKTNRLPVNGQAHLNPDLVQQQGNMATLFKYDTFWNDPQAINALAEEIASKLPQVDMWFKTDEIGPNIAVTNNPKFG